MVENVSTMGQDTQPAKLGYPVAGTTVRPSTRTKFISIDNNSPREPGELMAQVPTHEEMHTMGNLLRETVAIEATSLITQELDVVLCSACLC